MAANRSRIVVFPLARQRPLIVRLANQIAARPMALAERYLQQQLRRQVDLLHRRKVPDRIVEREVRALELAVRAELWRLLLTPSVTPPGAA
jgi:Family of unknown function (DUF6074)